MYVEEMWVFDSMIHSKKITTKLQSYNDKDSGTLASSEPQTLRLHNQAWP